MVFLLILGRTGSTLRLRVSLPKENREDYAQQEPLFLRENREDSAQSYTQFSLRFVGASS